MNQMLACPTLYSIVCIGFPSSLPPNYSLYISQGGDEHGGIVLVLQLLATNEKWDLPLQMFCLKNVDIKTVNNRKAEHMIN